MWGNSSYLVSIGVFAGSVVLLEWIFGFHRLKKSIKEIFTATALFVLITPIEYAALQLRIWEYNPKTTFNILFLGAEIETYVFSFVVGLAVSSAVVAWTNYEDAGKNIISQSLKDVLSCKYAIWQRKNK